MRVDLSEPAFICSNKEGKDRAGLDETKQKNFYLNVELLHAKIISNNLKEENLYLWNMIIY